MNIITLHQNMCLDSTEEEINFGQWLLTVSHGQNLTNNGCTILPEHLVNTDPQTFITKLCYNFEDIVLSLTNNFNSQSEKLRKFLRNCSGSGD